MAKQRFDGSISAEIMGSGPSIWLLHSLLADAGSCRPLAEALSATHRVVLPDLPGFGGSPPAEDVHDAARRVVAAIASDGPATLIGNGYGSFIALLVALDHPALVRHLVLAGTGAAFSEPGRAAFRAMAAGAAAKGLDGIADIAMRRLFAPAFQAANPALLDERRTHFLATDPAVFAQACADLAGLDLTGIVGGLRAPTLILVGELDEATPPAMARALADLVPDARFEELPGLAHVPQLQDVGRFMAAIEGAI